MLRNVLAELFVTSSNSWTGKITEAQDTHTHTVSRQRCVGFQLALQHVNAILVRLLWWYSAAAAAAAADVARRCGQQRRYALQSEYHEQAGGTYQRPHTGQQIARTVACPGALTAAGQSSLRASHRDHSDHVRHTDRQTDRSTDTHATLCVVRWSNDK